MFLAFFLIRVRKTALLSGFWGRAYAHLDISCPNLGVQEWTDGLSGLYPTLNGKLMQEIFPGMPERRDGYLYLNDKPGIGVDINEELAARYPCKNTGISWNWMLARLPDGTAVRP